jgi:hypothetical protein
VAACLALLRVTSTLALSSWPTGASSPPAGADDVLLGVMAWAATALSAWLALGVLLGLLAALPGRCGRLAAAVAARVTPAALRRVTALLVGASVGTLALPVGAAHGSPVRATTASAPADPAKAGPGWSVSPPPAIEGPTPLSPALRPTPTATTRPQPADGPGWRPTRPVRTAAPAPTLLTPTPRPSRALLEAVTVRRGDCLWSVVSRHLGPGASDAETAREVGRWYAANRRVIGDDPDLVLAGQQLVPPQPAGDRP